MISAGGGGHTLQKSKSGKELGLIEVNAPIYPVDTKHTFPPGRRVFLLQTVGGIQWLRGYNFGLPWPLCGHFWP